MPLPPAVTINGHHYSHASAKVRVLGLLLLGTTEWMYKPTIERGEARGSAREVLGHTIGEVKYEASCKVLRAYWDALKQELRSRGVAPMDAKGVIVITIAERGLPSQKIEIVIDGINEMEQSSSKGTDPLEVPLTFSVLAIRENGKALVADSLHGSAF